MIIVRNRDCIDLSKMASILDHVEGAAGPTSQDSKVNFYEVEVYQYSNSYL